MKRIASIVFPLLLMLLQLDSNAALLPDTIKTKAYRTIVCNVVLVSEDEIVYSRPNRGADSLQSIETGMIQEIVYSNGLQETFDMYESKSGKIIYANHNIYDDPYKQGYEDANQYFNYKQGFWISYGATLFYPLVGVATGITLGINGTDLRKRAPYPELLDNPEYRAGFRKKADKIVWRRVWGGIGTALLTYAYIIVAALL